MSNILDIEVLDYRKNVRNDIYGIIIVKKQSKAGEINEKRIPCFSEKEFDDRYKKVIEWKKLHTTKALDEEKNYQIAILKALALLIQTCQHYSKTEQDCTTQCPLRSDETLAATGLSFCSFEQGVIPSEWELIDPKDDINAHLLNADPTLLHALEEENENDIRTLS